MTPPAVEMRQITKTFPGLYRSVVANKDVDLRVEQGEFHVIVGENGAGKTTLMNLLYGLLHPDQGEILLFGQRANITSPKAAIDLGVGMIHQHFMLVPSFTVGENIVLGSEPTRATLVDYASVRRRIRQLSEELKLEVDPDARIDTTTVGVQQRVEILKALYRGARILILDEPTAVLTPQESETLFVALKRLCANGSTVIMITHKMAEVMAAADRVTVMRDGSVVGCFERHELDENVLAEKMTGRAWNQVRLPRQAAPPDPPTVLQVEHLACMDDRGLPAVHDVSFELHAGEILAIAGVAHNGQEELAEAIMGQRTVTAGQVHFAGQEVTHQPVSKIRSLGLGHIPDDRYGEGCARQASVARNMIMAAHNHPPLGNAVWIKVRQAGQWVRQQIRDYEVKVDHPDMPILSLSGGNVQKAIVAREIAMATHCLIAEQPSRGIDIGAAESIYTRLRDLRDQGVAVLLISMDLTEVLRLSDRILVIFNGRIVGERSPEHITQGDLGLLMAGVSGPKDEG
ncbi:MAG: ABC transporter ATP-binding protein [Chloroflexi bacterium]|nr:ABC transporter ATP-binding protein [Chloroflexota bacterium]